MTRSLAKPLSSTKPETSPGRHELIPPTNSHTPLRAVRYTGQHAAHALLLSTFPHDLAALEAIPLHPALQT